MVAIIAIIAIIAIVAIIAIIAIIWRPPKSEWQPAHAIGVRAMRNLGSRSLWASLRLEASHPLSIRLGSRLWGETPEISRPFASRIGRAHAPTHGRAPRAPVADLGQPWHLGAALHGVFLESPKRECRRPPASIHESLARPDADPGIS